MKALEAEDPPPERQPALTAAFLKEMLELCDEQEERCVHTAELIAAAFFFAMRACEFVRTSRPGKTKQIEIRDVTFRDRNKQKVQQSDPRLSEKARFVTICFRDQKNGKRMDTRSHTVSGDPLLCPVKLWIKVVKRARKVSTDSRTRVSICPDGDEDVEIKDSDVTRYLKATLGVIGHDHPSLDPKKIGTRSIRSGAAMALFMKNHHVERIKILGRWSSDAFLIYIRPQILEWTNLMAEHMAKASDMTDGRVIAPEDPQPGASMPAFL
ncbi:MAG: hypothetical protein F6J96_34570 [Symploca sp. SIO1C2]|nr:hypothetical protein [Symploca sp. SIO1C2]